MHFGGARQVWLGADVGDHEIGLMPCPTAVALDEWL